MAKDDLIEATAQTIEQELEAVTDASGKIDFKALRKRNAPLASVIDEFVMSKTTRDLHTEIARDVAVALEAKKNEPLGVALADLEEELQKD